MSDRGGNLDPKAIAIVMVCGVIFAAFGIILTMIYDRLERQDLIIRKEHPNYESHRGRDPVLHSDGSEHGEGESSLRDLDLHPEYRDNRYR